MGRDGGPILIAHGSVQGADDFVIAEPDAAQEGGVRLEKHRERSGIQFQGRPLMTAGVQGRSGKHGSQSDGFRPGSKTKKPLRLEASLLAWSR